VIDHNEQTSRIHLNRAFGGDRYHSGIDGDNDAGSAAGERASQGDGLPG
jgi:hypothetical protein